MPTLSPVYWDLFEDDMHTAANCSWGKSLLCIWLKVCTYAHSDLLWITLSYCRSVANFGEVLCIVSGWFRWCVLRVFLTCVGSVTGQALLLWCVSPVHHLTVSVWDWILRVPVRVSGCSLRAVSSCRHRVMLPSWSGDECRSCVCRLGQAALLLVVSVTAKGRPD